MENKSQIRQIVLLSIVAVIIIALACVIIVNIHTHDFSEEWRIGETLHWHECVCGAKSEYVAHAFIDNYQVDKDNVDGTENMVVSTTQKCSICAYVTAPVVLQKSSYVVMDSASIEGNARTISEAGIYILTGIFTNTSFTIDTPNVTLVGTGATTSGLNVVLTENADNTILHGLVIRNASKDPWINTYGDLTISNCTLEGLRVRSHKENLNISFDNNSITDVTYGIYVEYNDDADKTNINITNNTFDAITIYALFFYSSSSNSEIGDIVVANNSFINGWGDGKTAKRAVVKFYRDKNISPVDYGDTTDISKLTEAAKNLVRKILASNNTFDKGGKICSYFNINGIYFDTLDN